MRMLLTVALPNEPCNTLIKANKFAPLVKKILDEIKPEAAYFTEMDGRRGALLVVEVSNPSRVPVLSEPFFLNFNAECQFRICMSPEDLGNSDLDGLVKRWG